MKTNPDDKYYLLKELENEENRSQRELARELGFSLGKMNFLLKALMGKGLLKMENFAKNRNKVQYRYILTPKGINERVTITRSFLKRKEQEYERLMQEIEEAKQTVNAYQDQVS